MSYNHTQARRDDLRIRIQTFLKSGLGPNTQEHRDLLGQIHKEGFETQNLADVANLLLKPQTDRQYDLVDLRAQDLKSLHNALNDELRRVGLWAEDLIKQEAWIAGLQAQIDTFKLQQARTQQCHTKALQRVEAVKLEMAFKAAHCCEQPCDQPCGRIDKWAPQVENPTWMGSCCEGPFGSCTV